MDLNLETSKSESNITILKLSGRLTVGRERGQIEAAVLKALGEGVRKVVFDLSQVNYIDSTGIGAIAYCFGKISQQGGHAAVAGAGGMVREVFRLTRLDNVITFYTDVSAACEGLATTTSA